MSSSVLAAMTKPPNRASVLGHEIDNRLVQLGYSRREFARRANIGRQTLQDIIHNPGKRISGKTFDALDSGLKWQTGTARAFHAGNTKARDAGASVEQRINDYLLQILQRLAAMDIDQLEREVLILEEESGGFSDSATSRLIERQIRKLVASLITDSNGEYVAGYESHKSDPPIDQRGTTTKAP